MALSDQQQTSILQLVQAMFNVAPGAVYLQSLDRLMTGSGKSLADVAQTLFSSSLFAKNYSSDLTPEQFAVALVDDLAGDRASADNKAWAISYITNKMAGGATQAEIITELTQALTTIPVSDPDWGEAAAHYNTSIATRIIDNLTGDSVAETDKAFAVAYIVNQMAAGQTFGAMVEWAITALDGIDHADPVWGNAATLFDNRIAVSQYYSVDKAGTATDPAILWGVLAEVTTDPDSVIAAKAAIDNLIVDLSSLNGNNGFRLDETAADVFFGKSISDAGDVNNDGFDDVIVGTVSGSSYVVFGKATGFNATLHMSSLDGSNGFHLDGVALDDLPGRSVSSAGDINGDGYDDLIIGAPNYSGDSKTGSLSPSRSYVVLGKASGFNSALDLSDLNGNDGFRLNEERLGDRLGSSVSNAGDVNGDGFSDVIVDTVSGSSYVVFGKASGFDASMSLSALNGRNGFRLDGVTADDFSGSSISNAGDVNGDGFDDVIIGAAGADPNGNYSGSSYVVFGNATGFNGELELSDLDGSNGFRLDGVTADDFSGSSVSNAGDVNGDGFDDVIIGAVGADPNGNYSAGSSYVVFGRASGFEAVLNLSSLNGSNGFRLDRGVSDLSGNFVSGAGDINGDGLDDLIINFFKKLNGKYAGTSYVVFGRTAGFSATLDLSNLSNGDGFRLDGDEASPGNFYLDASVSGAGDINGDGFDDVMVAGIRTNPDGSYGRSSYVVFGGDFTAAVTHLGTSGNDNLTGTSAAERFVGGIGNDTISGGGGRDAYNGGSGDDIIRISDLDFQLVDGGAGSDTLDLAGSNLDLDLTHVSGRISGIETIGLTGDGNNTLTLTAVDLLNLSDTTNTLIVSGNTGDHVSVHDNGWADGGSRNGFHAYLHDEAVLLVGQNITVDFA